MTTADAPAATQRRLIRSHDGRVVAGVCEGAARYFDVDPVIFRVVLAVLTVFGGAGIVIYALAWVLIPDENSPQTHLERWLQSGRVEVRRVLLFALVAIAAVIFLGNTNLFAHRIGAAAVAVLAALFLTDFVGRRNGRSLFTSRRRFTPGRAAPVYYGPAPSTTTASMSYDGTTRTIPLPLLERPKRERSWLGWLTFGLVLLAAGVMSMVANSGAAHPQPADVLAGCVAICGVGLVVGALAGRARAMIPLGILLVMLLGIANALPRNLSWSAGTRSWSPVSSDLASTYVLGAGKADLDLTRLGAGTTASIDARLGAGRLMVFVPRGSGLVIDAKVSAGRVYVFGHEQDGTGVTLHQVIAPTRATAGTLTLHLEDGFGDVEVRNA